jgi:hypothetical protein
MATLEVRCTVLVPGSPERVWSFVAEEYAAHHHLWDPSILEMSLDGGPTPGATGVEVRRLGPRRQRTRFRVDEAERPRRFAFHDLDGPFDLARSYELAPANGGSPATELTFRFTMSPRGAVRLLFPLIRRGIERQVRANIDRLPGLVPTS